MRKMRKDCIACGGKMIDLGKMELQKGSYGLFLGSLSNLVSGALEVEAAVCEQCRRMDFYLRGEDTEDADRIVQTECPYCGRSHDLDDAVCPHCGKRLMTLD